MTVRAQSALILAVLFLVPGAVSGQGLDAEGAREAIIDAPVVTEDKPVAEENERIAAAIGSAAENAEKIRKLFNIGKVDIVLVEGLAEQGSPLAGAIESHAATIEALRKEIEGSAIFYHALDSQQVLLRDVVAVEFGNEDAVTIFVAKRADG
ncbi:MAG: hypothetical protein KF849_15670 [Rhizobiaceae bacterium]|nr:hypothetical protein [Rhizobiaceae bacterium]